MAVAIGLAAVAAYTLHPIGTHLTTAIVGDPNSDALRGMWGIDHLRRSLMPPSTPIWSKQVNFPTGVVAIVLPWLTGLLMAPLGWLFGPIATWNLAMGLMLWGAGMATAWLARTVSGSWPAGVVAGAAVMTQPMLLHAVSDGTAEHVAIWGYAAFLACAILAFRHLSPRLGIGAGFLAIAVALDSPYHVIYTAVAGLFVLPWALLARDATPRSARQVQARWTIGSMLSVVGIGALSIGLLYRQFPIDDQEGAGITTLWQLNATDLREWWIFDHQPGGARDPTLAPTVIPSAVLVPALVLAVIGLPRSLPWLAAGITMLGLSLGLNHRVPHELATWLGTTGTHLGHHLLDINRRLLHVPGLGSIRFPNRWLIPASVCLAIAGSTGLGRLFRLVGRRRALAVVLSLGLAAGAAWSDLRTARFFHEFPMQPLPSIGFAEWIGSRPGGGAVAMVPTVRPAPRSPRRNDLPVFANLGQTLASADLLYFQTIHGRPVTGYPNLKTLAPIQVPTDAARLLHGWDDLCQPVLTGNPIPALASDPRFARERKRGLDELEQAGLRWVVADLGALNDQGVEVLRRQLKDRVVKEKKFDEGDGVLVFELRFPE